MRATRENTDECHVRVWLNGTKLDYHAKAGAAHQFAQAVGPHIGAFIVVDDNLRGDLKPLPCANLWQHPADVRQ